MSKKKGCQYNVIDPQLHPAIEECGKKAKYMVHFTDTTDHDESIFTNIFCKKHFKEIKDCGNTGAYEKIAKN